MPRRPENPGTCAYCGEVITRRRVSKHLDKCPKRQEALEIATASGRPVETLWHLRVQDAYISDFWLDLEMTGSASLDKLDRYLARHLAGMLRPPEQVHDRWLGRDGCGQGAQGGLDLRAGPGAAPPVRFWHHLRDRYQSRLLPGRPSDQQTPDSPRWRATRCPESVCQECGQEAKWLCIECLYEENKTGHLVR